MDQRTGCWMIQNSGRTNTLRVQQYGLSAVPLRPQTSMPMAGQDVAVWIPVVPHGSAPGKSESFRLLILSGTERGRPWGNAADHRTAAVPVRRQAGGAHRLLRRSPVLAAAARPARAPAGGGRADRGAVQAGQGSDTGALGTKPVRRARGQGRLVQGRRLVSAARRSRPDARQPPGGLQPPGGAAHDHPAARVRVGGQA